MCAENNAEREKNTIFIFAIILINLEKERSYSMKWKESALLYFESSELRSYAYSRVYIAIY